MPDATPTASGLSVTSYTPNSSNSGVNAIASGEKWGGPLGTGISITYSFPASGSVWKSPYSPNNEPTGFTALTTAQAAAFRAELQAWANVANISFVEVADTPTLVGDIRVALSPAVQATGSFGWAYFPSSSPVGGDIWFNPASMSGVVPQPGDYPFLAGLHEIGHTLGLDHPLGNGAQAGFTVQQTIMSYNQWPNGLYRTVTALPGGGYSWSYKFVYTDTPSLLDIAAMQYMYGANTKFNAGDNTYAFSTTTPFFKTIWDGGGIDTISVSNFSTNCVINLNEGQFSSIVVPSDALPIGTVERNSGIYDGTNNLGIAYGAVIENAMGGAGDDLLTGNAANNFVDGGAGNDSLYGGLGVDTLYGGDGFDVIEGGEGDDVINGNRNGDTIFGGTGNDFIGGGNGLDSIDGGDGNDTIIGGLGTDTLTGSAGNDHFQFLRALDGIINIDTITDYTGGQDVIELSATIFTAYAGQIGSYVTPSANLTYNSATGVLAYDVDGAGAAPALTFAVLGLVGHPTLQGNDFLIIA
jgi:serralysin